MENGSLHGVIGGNRNPVFNSTDSALAFKPPPRSDRIIRFKHLPAEESWNPDGDVWLA